MGVDWGADPSAAGRDGGHGRRGRRPEPDAGLAAADRAIAALPERDLSCLTAEELADRVLDLERLAGMLAAHQAECVRVMDAAGHAQKLGARSTQAWLRSAARVAPGPAKSAVALARRLPDCPATAAAFAAGRVSRRHAEVLTRALAEIAPHLADADAMTAIERDLVAVAEQVDPLRLSDVCRRLRLAAAGPADDGGDWAAFQQRRLSISRTFAGMTVLDGVLDPVSAETVMTAVHALSAPTGPDDERTPAQRRADALTEICRRVLDTANTPTVAGQRPHVTVTIRLPTLTSQSGRDGNGSDHDGVRHDDEGVGSGEHDDSGTHHDSGAHHDSTENARADDVGDVGESERGPAPVGEGDGASRRADSNVHADRDLSGDGMSGSGANGGRDSIGGGANGDRDSISGGANGDRDSIARGAGEGGCRWCRPGGQDLLAVSGDAVGELGWAGPISPELARMIGCDATVTRIVLDPASQPLDVGRSTPVVPTGIRKALLVRDRHCRYPGCDIPGVWCDAHHIRHWAHGGPTALTNLILLCHYHHARLHLTGETISLHPDGTVTRTVDPDHHSRDGPAP